MKKIKLISLVLLIIINLSISFKINHQLTGISFQEKKNNLIQNNELGYYRHQFDPSLYLIEQNNNNLEQSFEQLYANSDLIIKGNLQSQKQETDLVLSTIQANQIYKGTLSNEKIIIDEFYCLDDYAVEGMNSIAIMDPHYGPIQNNKEYIFFLKELYPNHYTYVDLLYTKFPIDEIQIGNYQILNEMHTFDAKTFFNSDILRPLDYERLFSKQPITNDYIQSYLDMNNLEKQKIAG